MGVPTKPCGRATARLSITRRGTGGEQTPKLFLPVTGRSTPPSPRILGPNTERGCSTTLEGDHPTTPEGAR